MSNFVHDGTTLNFPKVNLKPIGPGGPTKYIRAEDWNPLCQAVYDLRAEVWRGELWALATGGDGTVGDPYTGWEAPLAAFGTYNVRANADEHFLITTRVDVPSLSVFDGGMATFTTGPSYVGGAFRIAGTLNGSSENFTLVQNVNVTNGNRTGNRNSMGFEVSSTAHVTMLKCRAVDFWCNFGGIQQEECDWLYCVGELANPFTTPSNPAPVSLAVTNLGTPGPVTRVYAVAGKYSTETSVAAGIATLESVFTLNGTDKDKIDWTEVGFGAPDGYDVWLVYDSSNGYPVGKVGSVAAGVHTFTYAGGALIDTTPPPWPQRNFWLANGPCPITVDATGGFTNANSLIGCKSNANTTGYHFVFDGGNGVNFQSCRTNGGEFGYYVAGANPGFIDDFYVEGCATREVVSAFRTLDFQLGVGANTLTVSRGSISNGAHAAVDMRADSTLRLWSNQFLGSASSDGYAEVINTSSSDVQSFGNTVPDGATLLDSGPRALTPTSLHLSVSAILDQFTVLLSGNFTLDFPTRLYKGWRALLEVTQFGGGNTLTLASGYVGSYTASGTDTKVDIVELWSPDGVSVYVLPLRQNL